MSLHSPASEADASRLVSDFAASRTPLAIRGGSTRSSIGRPAQTAATLSTLNLSGITLYEPSEQVIAARAGTPLAVIEKALADKGQMLPFEPMDHRALFGTKGEPTIGAVFSGNISGPARISRGAARDAAIGVRFINGRGEAIKSGGRVMKNVTGLDLTKLQCGAWGTLGLVTEVFFKVLAKPERAVTLIWHNLSDAQANALMCAALGSPFEPTGAAHLPAGMGEATTRTLLRLENFSFSIDYRVAELAKLLKAHGKPDLIEGSAHDALWRQVRDASFFAGDGSAVWRLSVAPTDGPKACAAIMQALPEARYFHDWGGGLIWLSVPDMGDAGAVAIRAACAPFGGHATLVRAAETVRAAVPVFEPLAAALMRVTTGIKGAIDPQGLFEPGRMHPGL
ncbi:MAG: FAD-binding protein [Bosea sp. (in: a-proteobacteria)]